MFRDADVVFTCFGCWTLFRAASVLVYVFESCSDWSAYFQIVLLCACWCRLIYAVTVVLGCGVCIGGFTLFCVVLLCFGELFHLLFNVVSNCSGCFEMFHIPVVCCRLFLILCSWFWNSVGWCSVFFGSFRWETRWVHYPQQSGWCPPKLRNNITLLTLQTGFLFELFRLFGLFQLFRLLQFVLSLFLVVMGWFRLLFVVNIFRAPKVISLRGFNLLVICVTLFCVVSGCL